ncbi:phosphoadenosine phosphosulfate reductase domain-containing protein [Riemerella anatipestifer]|uniref:phosphoadenosine phosphosulfate reductase domain-containing protein n=1 Tax=Riemerella anatipestifer TaxID=34085 RepID=UPI0012B26BE4|nr:phosphoadenosine phosphosulfate reductase family protein [Riemerella anatipestifer]MSN81962.1 hypothetical protein [Riemerella anatipestifer]NAV16679.1 hypothetical protein [Riemerella anatipestifer]QYR02321.1 phosphoadenosine phosphosulfate reductase family protein [Riemerella anatipestifer]UXN81009.1 phosphoadenosine phosphosulfate reductase family protein [Phage vB_RanS_PJN03]
MIRKKYNINVLKAAERRILETFNRNEYVSMSFSGGKDSICLADVTLKTMLKYNIDFSRLIVIFFDEEAIYPDIERITKDWRNKFISYGAKFYWFCLPIKHYNTCNQLANDESFICWEPQKQNVWVRPMPKFAIRNHKKFRMGQTYQDFAKSLMKGIPQMVGLRVAESMQRLNSIASMTKSEFVYPLYDWKDDDIWLYLQRERLDYPETYIYLYKVGVPKNKLRISQFFSIDTIKSLPKVLEFYPDLYQRVIRREPNADLAFLYYDTDMFRSNKQGRKHNENKDYKKILYDALKKATATPNSYADFDTAKKLLSKMILPNYPNAVYQKVYQILIAGDPKKREYRAVLSRINKENSNG